MLPEEAETVARRTIAFHRKLISSQHRIYREDLFNEAFLAALEADTPSKAYSKARWRVRELVFEKRKKHVPRDYCSQPPCQEILLDLEQACKRLSRDLQAILFHRFILGETQEQAAKTMGLSEKAVAWREHKLLATLKNLMKDWS